MLLQTLGFLCYYAEQKHKMIYISIRELWRQVITESVSYRYVLLIGPMIRFMLASFIILEAFFNYFKGLDEHSFTFLSKIFQKPC